MTEYLFLIYVIITFTLIIAKKYQEALLWPYILCLGFLIPLLILVKQMQKSQFNTSK